MTPAEILEALLAANNAWMVISSTGFGQVIISEGLTYEDAERIYKQTVDEGRYVHTRMALMFNHDAETLETENRHNA